MRGQSLTSKSLCSPRVTGLTGYPLELTPLHAVFGYSPSDPFIWCCSIAPIPPMGPSGPGPIGNYRINSSKMYEGHLSCIVWVEEEEGSFAKRDIYVLSFLSTPGNISQTGVTLFWQDISFRMFIVHSREYKSNCVRFIHLRLMLICFFANTLLNLGWNVRNTEAIWTNWQHSH